MRKHIPFLYALLLLGSISLHTPAAAQTGTAGSPRVKFAGVAMPAYKLSSFDSIIARSAFGMHTSWL